MASISSRTSSMGFMAALNDIANDRTSTVVFPLPLDLLQKLGEGGKAPD